LIVVGILAVAFPVCLVVSAQSWVARVIASVVALGFAAFCAFGFLATAELSEALRWPWQLGYGMLGVCALLTPVVLFLRNRAQETHAR
jgi:hypothetical protein